MLKEMMGMQNKIAAGEIDKRMLQKMAKKFRGKIKL